VTRIAHFFAIGNGFSTAHTQPTIDPATQPQYTQPWHQLTGVPRQRSPLRRRALRFSLWNPAISSKKNSASRSYDIDRDIQRARARVRARERACMLIHTRAGGREHRHGYTFSCCHNLQEHEAWLTGAAERKQTDHSVSISNVVSVLLLVLAVMYYELYQRFVVITTGTYWYLFVVAGKGHELTVGSIGALD